MHTYIKAVWFEIANLLGLRQENLCFHFAGSGKNLPDIAKSRDASNPSAQRLMVKTT